MALPVISRGHVSPGHELHYQKHMCAPDQPSFTPDRVQSDLTLVRDLAVDVNIDMPDGNQVKVWTIGDDLGNKPWPGVPIRVREGQIAHVVTNGKKHRHTLHFHGIEPTPMNDGVGHCSFEVGAEYTYQWQANQAGTFFYHCHVNTVLHFEMGLYGLLIVDPPEGPGRLHTGGPVYSKEYAWVIDDIDPVWHEFSHNAFMAGCAADGPFTNDGILHYFNPKYFCMTGVFSNAGRPITNPAVAVTARAFEPVLIRLLNGAYCVAKITLGVDVDVWGRDGKALGGGRLADGSPAYPSTKYSKPFRIPAGQSFQLSTAQRWDLFPDTTRPGVYPAKVEYQHWMSGKVLHTLNTTITVTN